MPLIFFPFSSHIKVILGQKEEHKSYVIYFISNNLISVEKKYMFTKKEFNFVVHSINKFGHHIKGYPMFIHTDHFPINYLINKPITIGRVTKWLLLL